MTPTYPPHCVRVCVGRRRDCAVKIETGSRDHTPRACDRWRERRDRDDDDRGRCRTAAHRAGLRGGRGLARARPDAACRGDTRLAGHPLVGDWYTIHWFSHKSRWFDHTSRSFDRVRRDTGRRSADDRRGVVCGRARSCVSGPDQPTTAARRGQRLDRAAVVTAARSRPEAGPTGTNAFGPTPPSLSVRRPTDGRGLPVRCRRYGE